MVREREAELGFGSDVMVSAGDLHMELITIQCNMKSEKNFNPAKELREVFLEEVVHELRLAGGERTHGCGTKNQCRGSVVKNLPANAEVMGSIPELGRSPGEGNGNRLQYSCLENPMDKGALETTVHRIPDFGHN